MKILKKWEIEFKIAELLEESKEQERFDAFLKQIPSMRSRVKTEESHLPLLTRITSANNKGTAFK